MMKDFLEITVKTTHDASELVADILSEYSDQGVSVLDAEDVNYLLKTGKNWDYADDGVISADATVFVKGYVPEKQKEYAINGIKGSLNALKENCPFPVGELSVSVMDVDGNEWREKWKENFKPIKIGDITVVPKWIDYNGESGKTVLLDSNMAFGTGEHETTSMCVKLLQKYVEKDSTVIDVGCGSGILGIAAAKLGAKKVIMTDIDECAITATEQNLKLNGVSNARVFLKNLLDDNTVKGDVIVANIMAEVLISFAAGLKNNLNAGGTVILSGILTDRLDKVVAAYTAQGFTLLNTEIKGEWAAVVLQGI